MMSKSIMSNRFNVLAILSLAAPLALTACGDSDKTPVKAHAFITSDKQSSLGACFASGIFTPQVCTEYGVEAVQKTALMDHYSAKADCERDFKICSQNNDRSFTPLMFGFLVGTDNSPKVYVSPLYQRGSGEIVTLNGLGVSKEDFTAKGGRGLIRDFAVPEGQTEYAIGQSAAGEAEHPSAESSDSGDDDMSYQYVHPSQVMTLRI